jgi:low affinity Fe/Cu permease
MMVTKSVSVTAATSTTVTPVVNTELGRAALQSRLDQAIKELEYQETKVSVAREDIEKAHAEVERLERELAKELAELRAADLVEAAIRKLLGEPAVEGD